MKGAASLFTKGAALFILGMQRIPADDSPCLGKRFEQ